ncbi:MAG: ABC transporter permease [Pirellulales bacterium]
MGGQGVTYEVVSANGGTISEAVIDAVTNDANIQNLLPIAQEPSIVRLRGKRLKTLITGVDLSVQKLSPQLTLEQGSWEIPETISYTPVLLDDRFAKALGAELGTQVLILTQRGLTRCETIGIYRAANPADIMAPRVLMDLPDFQDALGRSETLSMLRLEMTAERDSPELLASIQAQLPAGLLAGNRSR